MTSYSVRDVERVLRLSRSTVLSLVSSGFVSPTRGKRREYRFSFQDLIVLRAARALLESRISPRRIRRSLADLRQHLPEDAPLHGLSIAAVGDRVVVREGKSRWQVDDGQYVLGLDVSIEDGVLRVVERKQSASPPQTAEVERSEHWFDQALILEDVDPAAALQAYERAVQLEVDNLGAWVNWGRLLHQQQQLHAARELYRRARQHFGEQALLLFNYAVLLEDLDETSAAVETYLAAVAADPSFADSHFNLARLFEALGKPQHAIRHLGEYRRLQRE